MSQNTSKNTKGETTRKSSVMQHHTKDQENPPEEEGTAGEVSSSPDRCRRMQEPSQTGVCVSIQPTEGVAIPATPIYHHLPTMEGTHPGLHCEEIAGPSGRAWTQGMNPVNTMLMDEYVLQMQSLVEYSQQMMAETHTLIQQSILTTTRYQEEVRGMYLNQNVETSPTRDNRRTDYGALGESLSRSISLAVSTAIKAVHESQ